MAFNVEKTKPIEFKQLADLIVAQAIIPGEVILASGKKANYYVDLRKISLHKIGSKLIGVLMQELTKDLEYDAVGGLTLGADPIATAIMHTTSKNIHAFVVRKTVKEHGMGKQIEGPDINNKKVLIVEDTTTTGASPMQAVKTVTANGAEVVAVATLVNRETGAEKIFAAAKIPYRFVFNLTDLGLKTQ